MCIVFYRNFNSIHEVQEENDIYPILSTPRRPREQVNKFIFAATREHVYYTLSLSK